MASRASNSDGYVTLAALVFAGVLAAVVSSTLAASRPTLGLARLGAQQLAADGLLDGGIAIAAHRLFAGEADPRSLDGAVLRIGQGAVRLSVRHEAGRVDLNAADAELLAALYAAAGGRAMSPAAFADRVIDWRDGDSTQSAEGAESAQYAAARAGWRPRNGPFRSTADLGFVIGVGADELSRLQPFATVYNPDGGIDPLGASETLLASLPDLSRQDLALLLEARRQPALAREEVTAMLSSPSRHFVGEAPGIYRVRVAARLENGFERAAEGVIVPPTGPLDDYGVIYWARQP